MPHVTRSDQDKLINSILNHVKLYSTDKEPDFFYPPIDLPDGIYESTAKNGWSDNWIKFEEFLYTGIPQYTIFTKGNGKLPFYSFSSLPGVTCPGAGDCLKFCYSFKSWRYPAAFFRQIQNTILLMSDTGRKYLREEFNKLEPNHDFRLYVDGDFDSLETMKFWMDLLKSRPDINPYGYSKSWNLFIEYNKLGYTFPDNYELNLSSGSIYQNNKTILDQISKLSIYRGEFIALPSDEKMPNILEDRPSFTAWAKQLRERAKLYGIKKAWVCPGKCGNCTPTGHACGSKRFKNVPIIIGIH